MTAKVVRRAWTVGWLGAAVLGVANGTVRNLVYQPRLDELAAHQLSTCTLIVLLTLYLVWLDRRWPLPSTATAVRTGAGWAVATLAFEFGLGLGVQHKALSALLADYDITSGRVWVLVPLWMLIGPALIRRGRRHRPDSTRPADVDAASAQR
ncbi:hypothetical protein EV138_1444 [Kribbella voronezhensis]|uniref:Uncharacterized protein n=1 Tax=Kribbella voronezhensis TaxID=2512212 RepID=A0A4R7T9K0_9ACTN|nr:hypothetical protein [Kribbella voronezhensis]TDU87908.1 hypothetical protein EV138_1444 [Kribbella voronezhensis]